MTRHPHAKPGNAYVQWTLWLLAVTAVLMAILAIAPSTAELRLASYLPLHMFLETASIFVCVLVFLVSRSAISKYRSRNMVILGAVFLGVAALDFQHALSYLGMPAFVTPASPSKAINFWLAARFLTVGALLVAAFCAWEQRASRSEAARWTAAVVGVTTVISWVLLYRAEWMPQTFVPGRGLTWFKIAAEYVIIGLSLVAAYGFYQQRRSSQTGQRHDAAALMTACIVTALAELFFTVYTDVNGLLNVLGHVYKLVAAWLIYQGLVAENLGEVEARLQLAREAAGIALFDLDVGSGQGEWQDDFHNLLGISPGAPRTFDSVLERIRPEDRERFLAERAQRLSRGGHFSYELRILTHDNAERWVFMRGEVSQTENGKPMHLLGAASDITEHKLAERRLALSESRLSGLVDQANDAIISVDRNQKITLFNRGAEAIFGYAAAEIIGQPLNRLLPNRTHAAHTSHVDAFARGLEVSRRMGERGEIFGLHKDGREFPAEASISRLELPTGPIFTAIVRDITERKRHQAELELRVAERTQELQDEIRRREAAQTALVQSQRMDALGQLTGGVAHDSNNLLTVISGNLEMVEDELGDHPAMKYVREAQEAAAMGARLNQRLLTFARRRKLEPQVINLNDQILAMSELLRRSLGETINLTTVLMHNLWSTRVDLSEVENAVLNLAINSRDAMPNGGNLQIETRNVSLSADAARNIGGITVGDYVVISVSDSGVGMSPEVQRRVFEPFFTTKEPGKGTGLGLSSLYGFATQSRGAVTIDSDVGRGTKVDVYLPRVVDGQCKTGPQLDQASHMRARGETVLVVEDNRQVRTLTVQRFQRLGFHVVEAENGPAAMVALEQNPKIDLVFTDVVMPGGMSGFDLMSAARERQPTLRFLLTSGFSEDVARNWGHAIESQKILRKPYSLAELAQALNDVLGTEV